MLRIGLDEEGEFERRFVAHRHVRVFERQEASEKAIASMYEKLLRNLADSGETADSGSHKLHGEFSIVIIQS